MSDTNNKVNVFIDTKTHVFETKSHFDDNQHGIQLLENKYFEQLSDFLDSYKTKNDFSHYTKYLNGFLALETMFGLLCSVAQSPYYFYGWLLKYSNSDLYSVVGKITTASKLPNPHKLDSISWTDLARIIHPDSDGEDRAEMRNDFARIWEKLAKEYLTKDFQEAYNSIKHGLRARPDGIVQVKFEEVDSSGKEFILSGSDFGFRFGVIETVDGINTIRHKIVNFNRELFGLLFEIVHMTIFNIRNYLKSVNFKGKVETEQFVINHERAEEFLSIERPGLQSLVFDIGGFPKK